MSSNYEWQKQQARERLQSRLHEAEAHRQAKLSDSRLTIAGAMKIVITALVGLIVAIWLLTGCTTYDAHIGEAEAPASSAPRLTMANRIRFQDEREASLTAHTQQKPAPRMTLADRIHFQDQRAARLEDETALRQMPVSTMAARIHFHDKLWEQESR